MGTRNVWREGRQCLRFSNSWLQGGIRFVGSSRVDGGYRTRTISVDSPSSRSRCCKGGEDVAALGVDEMPVRARHGAVVELGVAERMADRGAIGNQRERIEIMQGTGLRRIVNGKASLEVVLPQAIVDFFIEEMQVMLGLAQVFAVEIGRAFFPQPLADVKVVVRINARMVAEVFAPREGRGKVWSSDTFSSPRISLEKADPDASITNPAASKRRRAGGGVVIGATRGRWFGPRGPDRLFRCSSPSWSMCGLSPSSSNRPDLRGRNGSLPPPPHTGKFPHP